MIMQFISVVIPTYNRQQSLFQCLGSLAEQTYPKEKFEVIVVDDGSRDHTKTIALSFAHKLALRYFYKNNGGPASARNYGINYTNGAIIAFIDDDCVADTHWIASIDRFFSNAPDALIVQGGTEVLEKKNPLRKMHEAICKAADKKRILQPREDCPHKTALFFGPGNAAVRKSALFEQGLLFDDAIHYREDTDLYRRIKEKNITIYYDEHIAVGHLCKYDPVNFFCRFFNYGKGGYRLDKKWEGKTFAPWIQGDITFASLKEKYGLVSAAIIYLASPFRSFAYKTGFHYERLRQRFLSLKNPARQ